MNDNILDWHVFYSCCCVHLTKNVMGSILYVIAVILVIAWLIGFLGFAAGGLIHVLLVIAIIAVLLNVIGGNRRNI